MPRVLLEQPTAGQYQIVDALMAADCHLNRLLRRDIRAQPHVGATDVGSGYSYVVTYRTRADDGSNLRIQLWNADGAAGCSTWRRPRCTATNNCCLQQAYVPSENEEIPLFASTSLPSVGVKQIEGEDFMFKKAFER